MSFNPLNQVYVFNPVMNTDVLKKMIIVLIP